MRGRKVRDNAPMDDHQRCRLSVDDGELELAGPPAALRGLGRLLRQHSEPFEVAITGGAVRQEATAGPLLVRMQDGTTLRFSGGREYLDIVWDALDGVAEQAETADDRTVNRHQHIEYLPGDHYRSPDSVPLVIVADWPDAPQQLTY
ncbi:Imm32 family immunity protein [Plantactinospora sp. CA-294935]|uniref:Imm32 family immunity protein n=1 Tax=Plantactinospora sp. CA-294935 TaxID=3240012 RepID=UPI003D94456A